MDVTSGRRIVVLLLAVVSFACAQFQWQSRDQFDVITQMRDRVNQENCKVMDRNGLFLQASTVTHVPDLKWLGIDPVFPNRTNLLHIHNMALSRAFYFRSVPLIV
jgi:hypothetical protein